ncbi:Methyltransferase-like protein 1 [Forsythia ovata]|uniref:Methyltransferase-like protein 1 n=1 Tax=Forsythia ovata TaxID=205694 RepID=A0ABD1QBM8_9LAMI
MGSPERTRSSLKQDVDEDVEVNIDSVREDDEWDGDDKRKHRSNKSRKPGSGEDADGLDGSARKRSAADRHESRKRVAGTSRADSDQDDYEAKKERSKQMKKKVEVNALEKMSSWYQDGEAENKHESGDKSGSRGHSRSDERDRKKSNSKYSDHDFNVEKVQEKDSRYTDRTDSGREKGHGSAEHGRNSQRRWDESDSVGKDNEYLEKSDVRSGKSSDPKLESGRERNDSLKIEPGNSKSKGLDLDDKGIKAQDREERRADSERTKRGKFEAPEDIEITATHEDRSSKERFEENRQPRNPTNRDADSRERSFNADEDGSVWMRDKSRREVDSSNVSRTPERSGRRHYESDNIDMDYERSASFRRKELGKDSPWDDRSKERDDSWGEKSRDRENIKDNWKRRQDKEARDGEGAYNQGRDWEFSRRGRERIDGERPHGRSGGRKDGSRTEAVKTSSKYGISNDNYDVIEIQTKSFDYGREEPGSMFARSSEVVLQSDPKLAPGDEEFGYSRSERSRNAPGSGSSGEGSKERFMDGGLTMPDSWRDDTDFQAENSRVQKGVGSNHGVAGQSSSSGSQLQLGNSEPGSFGRAAFQGVRGSRVGRGGRGRPTGRDSQQAGIPIPLMGSPFGPLGMPMNGPMQSLTPNMSPAPVPPISPGVFIPPFQPPVVWPGARGVEMNMLAVPPGLPPVPPGPSGPRFPPNMGNPPNPVLFFNPSGPGRGTTPNMSGPNFNANAPAVRGQPQDKALGGWVPSRSNGPHGKAPSRGEQNDYSQNFVDTGMRPQNFIRELELTSVVEDYPKLRELIQKKDEIVAKSSSPPMYYKCDLREQLLSPEFFATKFDVILVDPPWEEYVHRAPGVTDHMEYWTFEEIMNLKIEAIADTPSFIFLWVGDGVGLEQGRQCLKKWGFRRCEDICWVKTNKTNATPGLRHDSHTLFQRSKEHCLMGIKGTVRRSTDGHIIHANIDTDVIIAEEPPYGSTAKPEDMYRIIEHFALGRRRLELFGEDHNIRSGWLTVGKGLSSSNFNAEAYIRSFMDKDGKVWQGGGGRNPPPEAPHLVLTTPEIESLRPKSPMKNQLQMQQQQSASITLTTANSSNKRTTGNSPQNHNAPNLNQEASSSNVSTPGPWASPIQTFKGREGGYMGSDDRVLDVYGYNAPPFGPASGDFSDYESQRGLNML